ncbi:MAG TPA: aminodeoxychorismate synthase component I [Acidocella sp.]|jgi:para-aminobenzoate synthetase component 1|uniref:aminodeoxychorismate synthase component I n=1 Tax=Acidocella sp. TaxID=50710 RepID=UPI002C8A60E1|nr:aminodeoxychorismate synthase component I [Acidocella sp.]HVE23221.1 aminodeoxychorismate synthase component I [Acidocella sp.]
MLVTELPWRAPLDSFAACAGEPYVAFLDSAATNDPRASISYLCLDPVSILSLPAGSGDPFIPLAAWLDRHRPARPLATAPLPFIGGAVGFLSYELGVAAAGIATRHPRMAGLPDAWFGLYDTVLGFDHRSRRLWFIGHDRPGAPAAQRLAALAARLARPAKLPPAVALDWQPEWTEAGYRARVEQVRAYIGAGDIFQANLTHRFRARRPAQFSAAGLYAALRRRSPAPFASFLSCDDDVAIISASPEAFLSLAPDGRVETRPIKGTIRRGATPDEDEALGQELSRSPKDRAENLMIADLMRNDLGRVCATGSVKVTSLCALERFASAQHLVSVVEGRLKPGLGAIDLLRASFPAGSITGAPKYRAMQIIDEIETAARGAYCGTLAWLGFDGAMGSSVMIRSIVATKEALFAQAGGGIVWDSDPAAEYAEMRLKAAPLLAAGNE